MNATLAVEWGVRGAIPAVIVMVMLVLLRVRDHALEQKLWRSALAFACAVPLVTIAIATGSALMTSPAAMALSKGALPTVVTAANELVSPLRNDLSWAARTAFAAVGVWTAVSLVLLLRVAIGGYGSWRLLHTSLPAPEQFARDTRVRISHAIVAPATVGSTVLLPNDVAEWNSVERNAVIAHELNHVQRGDFWWQLLSHIYAAIYWWNPASWAFVYRLRWLAERLSDAAALRVMPDRSQYASLLVQVASRAKSRTGARLPAFRVAMSRRLMLRRRVDAVIRAVESVPLIGMRRAAAFGAPLITAAAVAITPLPGAELAAITPRAPSADHSDASTAAQTPIRADSVVIKLYAARTIDAAAQAVIARSSNPDSLQQSYAYARSDAHVRWIALNPDGTERGSGETPAVITQVESTPFAVTYCSADPSTQLRVEYRFAKGGSGSATGVCSKIFRSSERFGSEGVRHPRGR
jgi:beta-lactamase regulating signal transducer with metallopeptidase domain